MTVASFVASQRTRRGVPTSSSLGLGAPSPVLQSRHRPPTRRPQHRRRARRGGADVRSTTQEATPRPTARRGCPPTWWGRLRGVGGDGGRLDGRSGLVARARDVGDVRSPGPTRPPPPPRSGRIGTSTLSTSTRGCGDLTQSPPNEQALPGHHQGPRVSASAGFALGRHHDLASPRPRCAWPPLRMAAI